MLALLGNSSEPIAPQTMFVQMANFPMVEAHMSPKDGKFHDVNVIGMDLLSHLKTTILGKRLEFELSSMSDS